MGAPGARAAARARHPHPAMGGVTLTLQWVVSRCRFMTKVVVVWRLLQHTCGYLLDHQVVCSVGLPNSMCAQVAPAVACFSSKCGSLSVVGACMWLMCDLVGCVVFLGRCLCCLLGRMLFTCPTLCRHLVLCGDCGVWCTACVCTDLLLQKQQSTGLLCVSVVVCCGCYGVQCASCVSTMRVSRSVLSLVWCACCVDLAGQLW